MGCKGCQKAVTVRATCGGRKLCISPWVAILLILIFVLVLCVRCQRTSPCVTDVAQSTADFEASFAEETYG